MPYFRYSCKLHTKLQPLNFVKAAPEIGWWSHLAWQWCPTLTGLWRLSHQRTLWGLALCYFLEWEAWSLTPFYLLTILDTAFQSFLARVSHRDVGIGLGTFPTPWFAGVLSAGTLAVLIEWHLSNGKSKEETFLCSVSVETSRSPTTHAAEHRKHLKQYSLATKSVNPFTWTTSASLIFVSIQFWQ